VVFVDEANMLPGRLFEELLKEASFQGAKVILIQDLAQIKSRDPGDMACILWEKWRR
jgi:ATP-dependent exoDNAse (exonuclease V) alpha subunit